MILTQFLEFVNEVYANENAAVGRISSRIGDHVEYQLNRKRLQEILSQRNRSSQIFSGCKANQQILRLPCLSNHQNPKSSVKENIQKYLKSITYNKKDDSLPTNGKYMR